MRTLLTVLVLAGLVVSTGCTNTATGFGKDLEKSGQAIQKTVTKKETGNNAGNNARYQPAPSTYNGGSTYNNPEAMGNGYSDSNYTPPTTPSGY